jgi:serine/threonine-protein kinase
MSPEQCDPRSNIDGRTDIFAFGRVLYEMVTGRLPYPCESGRDAIQLTSMNAPFPRPSALRPNLPPAWDAAIMACLEHNRNRRIADANEVLWRMNPSPISIASSPAMTSSPAAMTMRPAMSPPLALGSTPAAIASSPAAARAITTSSPAAVTLSGVPGAAAVTLSGAPGAAWFQARSDLESKRRARALVFVLGVFVGISLVGWIAFAIAR